MELKGSRIWLTGASSGIGAALALELALRGSHVALFARNAGRLEAVRATIRRTLAGRGEPDRQVLVQYGDVTDRARVRAAVEEAESELEGLDIAVLNAGIGDILPASKFRGEAVRKILEVNFMGAVHGIEAVLPGMLSRGHGALVAISSVAAYRGLPQAAPYCASKAALTTLFESLRLDLAPYGIRVLTVSPGFVKTPLTDRNRFPMPFLLTPGDAARRIADGIQKNRRDIHFPRRLTYLMKLLRVLPVWLYDPLVARIASPPDGGFKDSASG